VSRSAASVLHLVRHGETTLAGSGVVAGRLDVPLSARGEAQARAAAALLAGRPLAAVVASPLSRTRATAALIAAAHGLVVELDPDLRELDFGVAEGLTFEELERRDPATAAAWVARPHEVVFPGGEGLRDVTARALRAAQAVLRRHGGREVAIVSHAGPIRALLGLARELAPADAIALDCPHGSVTSLELPDGRIGPTIRPLTGVPASGR
jgi:broad specificity phosphatase PhoE